MQLERKPHHSSKVAPSHLSQLERNPQDPRHNSIGALCYQREGDPSDKQRSSLTKLERIPLPNVWRNSQHNAPREEPLYCK